MSSLEGFEEIYRLYYKDVLSMCLNQDLAEEIAQEAFSNPSVTSLSR